MAKDLTGECLEDVRKTLGEKVTDKDLRRFVCWACRNTECDHAKNADIPWTERMKTQMEKMFGSLRVTASPDDPRWEHLQDIEFPNLLREAIRLEVADRKGDWSVPEFEDGLDMLSGRLPVDEVTEENSQVVEDAVKALREHAQGPSEEEQEFLDEEPEDGFTIIEVESETKRGAAYEVRLDEEGVAVSCTCNAGKYNRPCKHRGWAEGIFRRQRDLRQVVEEPDPFTTRRPQTPRQAPPQQQQQTPRTTQRQPPETRLRNTQTSQQGVMVDTGDVPKGGLLKDHDPWSPKPQVRHVKPGAVITIGGKKDE